MDYLPNAIIRYSSDSVNGVRPYLIKWGINSVIIQSEDEFVARERITHFVALILAVESVAIVARVGLAMLIP